MRDVERQLFFDDMGNVVFRRNPRARRLSIRIKPDGQVSVTIPYSGNYRSAVQFVEMKREWILRIQKKIKKKNNPTILFNELTEFSTVTHQVEIKRYAGDRIREKRDNNVLKIQIPEAVNIESKEIQNTIKKAIINTWRLEAKEILSKRIHELASEYNFRFSEIKIKNMRTRWGSCSRKNSINLNLHVVRLPDHLRDYILLHELAHTIHKNHGKDFWELLNSMTGGAKALAKELRGINIEQWETH